jgi:phosphatidylserine decarboxylase
MKENFDITYYDRASGVFMSERVYARAFLFWSYNTSLGQFTTNLLLRQRLMSRLYGWFHKQRWSRRRIQSFVQKMKVNVDDLVCPLDDFTDFNSFFTRDIDLSKRPINQDPRVCVAPTDGKVLAYPFVGIDTTFRVKRGIFNLRRFLQDDFLAKKYAGGSMVISRLCLPDYHHFHFPDSGIPSRAQSIRGKYYAVGPYALRTLIPFYTENHRMMTLFNSDHFGQVTMIEVGAFTVGSIKQRYRDDEHVPKGARKGFFELGGSTVVLLFRRGAIQLDEDLCSKTQQDLETYVRLGESIGKI